MPNDAVLHEFRSLVLFALNNYREAATAAYAVLSAGPGWNWTTLSGLYQNVADYTTQLRALEAYVKENPSSSDAHFLLAYHYLTTGFPDAAQKQLRDVDKLTPNDRLVKQLLGISSVQRTRNQQSRRHIRRSKPTRLIKAEQLVGVWTCGRQRRFEVSDDARKRLRFRLEIHQRQEIG